MPYFFYGYDPYYWMILVPAMLIALFAQLKVSSTFNRYDRVRSARGYTGAQAAEAVLRQHGVTDVRIERVRGRLTDHLLNHAYPALRLVQCVLLLLVGQFTTLYSAILVLSINRQ